MYIHVYTVFFQSLLVAALSLNINKISKILMFWLLQSKVIKKKSWSCGQILKLTMIILNKMLGRGKRMSKKYYNKKL